MMNKISKVYELSKWKNVVIIALFISSTAYYSSSSNSGETGTADKPVKYYMKMTKSQKADFILKIRKISLNDHWENVRKILGEPDIEHELIPKESNVSRGIVRLYYVEKLNKELVNEIHDQVFRMVFNKKNEVIELYSNINDYPRYEKVD